MDFSDKLKKIRKDQGLSQEELGEKIGVSRQAITKWETGRGMPDIENIIILAEIFKTTVDELLDTTISDMRKKQKNRSETIYDIETPKHFDIKLGTVKEINLHSTLEQKIYLSVESSGEVAVSDIYKIKIDENKNNIDIDAKIAKEISSYDTGDQLIVNLSLPQNLVSSCEIDAAAQILRIKDFHTERLEYDGAADRIIIEDTVADIDFTGTSDYDIRLKNLCGNLDVNQIKGKSIVHLKEENLPKIENNGRFSKIYCRQNGEYIDCAADENSEYKISISGMWSELLFELE